jgi:zinc protease
VEVVLMGDFETEEAVKILSETFGAMKPRKPGTVSVEGQTLSFPAANKTPLVRKHVGPADQAAAVIAWPTAGGLARITESRELEVLAAIFRDRLFEKFRAEQAVSYSPNMANKWPEEFSSGGYLMSISQVQPQDVERFFKFSQEVARDLAANPVSVDELQRSVEPIKQLIDRVSSGNTFWLNSLQGATFNQEKFVALGSIFSDYQSVTPERLQELAKRYFRDDTAWKFTVLPQNAAEPVQGPTQTGR